MKTTGKILASCGDADAITQVSEAFVRVLNATTPENRPIVAKKILKGFDPYNPMSGGGYKFSPRKKGKYTMDADSTHELEAYMNATIRKHGGQIDPFVNDILSVMYDGAKMSNDKRVMFFTGLIFSSLCPYNFYGSGVEVTDEEFEAVRNRSVLFDVLNAYFANKVRFVGLHDKAAYFMQLMADMTEKERLIALGIVLDTCEKKAKVEARKEQVKTIRIPGMPASLSALMEAIAEAHSGCACPECRAGREHARRHSC
jgi:hypothetical protein